MLNLNMLMLEGQEVDVLHLHVLGQLDVQIVVKLDVVLLLRPNLLSFIDSLDGERGFVY